jgi:hypothetical protein
MLKKKLLRFGRGVGFVGPFLSFITPKRKGIEKKGERFYMAYDRLQYG